MSTSDYYELVKPKIIPLLVFVAVGSSIVAARGLPPLRVLLGVVLGGSLASAGSLAFNSYLEMDIDAKMKRTRNRPLPAGAVPPAHALALAGGLLTSGILVALLTIDLTATFFIALGAVVYVPIYTLVLKRRTTWNIVLGGFAGSCAALAGWYAVTSSDALAAWVLGGLVFVWTPSHFWSLAVITEDDYTAVGIPMLPSVVGPQAASRYIVANTLILIPVSLLLSPYLSGLGLAIYLVGALAFGLCLLATNIKLLVSPTKENAWLAFKFSSPYLAVIFLIAIFAVLV
ncbi:MAG TPA: heme o synthase [Nitrososphaerales archaeon]|nr:heme o synthase [Nitrososphaerales archaeon]